MFGIFLDCLDLFGIVWACLGLQKIEGSHRFTELSPAVGSVWMGEMGGAGQCNYSILFTCVHINSRQAVVLDDLCMFWQADSGRLVFWGWLWLADIGWSMFRYIQIC